MTNQYPDFPVVNGTNPRSFVNQRKNLLFPPNGACLTDNRWQRAITLFRHYMIQFISGIKAGIPIKEMLVTRKPYLFQDLPVPPGLHIEFTNFCNLKCSYCTNPDRPRPQGMMEDDVFTAIIKALTKEKISRIYLVGLGESTLHPSFSEYLFRLRKVVKYISLTSNMKKVNEVTLVTILTAPIDLLNISVDGFDRESYERYRVGGNFNELISNLKKLNTLKKKLKSRTIINIRLMLPPSLADRYKEIKKTWEKYCDEVSPQFVVNINGKGGDVFDVNVEKGKYPKCSLPFKQLQVLWNGDVPMCTYSNHQEDNDGDFVLGNIKDYSITELWNKPVIKNYRIAHRTRDFKKMPLCNGCGGC